MKRIAMLLGLALAWMLGMTAEAQTAAYNGYCTLGATAAVTSGLQSYNKLQGVISQCTVTVYLTGTVTLATIYSDSISTPLSNPFTATTSGSWLFYASLAGYDVKMSGGVSPNTYPSPVTLTDLSGGFCSSGGVCSVIILAAGTATPTTIGSNGVLLNGVPALQSQTSLFNYYSGGAGNLTGTGDNNTANGFQALNANTTGSNNTANGYHALYSNTTG